jgi:hypothetical protein
MKRALDRDSLWKQYQLHIDLYKYYLDMVIKFNVFYYAVTGAILSFYFSKTEVSLIRYSLLFPILLSVSFGGFFLYGSTLLEVVRQEVFDIRDKLQLDTAPEMNVLKILLRITAVLFLFVAICLLVLFFVRTD